LQLGVSASLDDLGDCIFAQPEFAAKGIVIAGAPTGAATVKVQNGAPGDDPLPPANETPVTLIGLIETNEGLGADMWLNRKYFFNTVNDSAPVNTRFVP